GLAGRTVARSHGRTVARSHGRTVARSLACKPADSRDQDRMGGYGILAEDIYGNGRPGAGTEGF
ncbi:MAG: hypothetical protein Q6370_022425, partial [Candidatus Sigynarchaeota archaeon]